MTVLIAEIIIDTIKYLYNVDLEIKSPNDIIYENRKIGGILTESLVKGEIAEDIIIGIGLNINQMEFNDEIKDKATSLKKEFHMKFSRKEILIEFLQRFETKYLEKLKI